MKISIVSIIVLLSAPAFAAKLICTKEDKSKWMDQKKFQEDRVAEGYKIKVFKVANDSCYEIYGWNKEGKKVEIYFNPVDAKIVKQSVR